MLRVRSLRRVSAAGAVSVRRVPAADPFPVSRLQVSPKTGGGFSARLPPPRPNFRARGARAFPGFASPVCAICEKREGSFGAVSSSSSNFSSARSASSRRRSSGRLGDRGRGSSTGRRGPSVARMLGSGRGRPRARGWRSRPKRFSVRRGQPPRPTWRLRSVPPLRRHASKAPRKLARRWSNAKKPRTALTWNQQLT
jgi:hypothetical protein